MMLRSLFLIAYGNKYGLPLQGRLPNYKEHRIILLPSDKSKENVYYDYIAAAEEVHTRKVSLSEFKKLWLQQCPHITIMRPATELLHKCQMYVSIFKDSGNLSEEEKCSQLQEYQHLEDCKIQRDEYRQLCDDAKATYSQMPDYKKPRGNQACSSKVQLHYSFDYAQQVHFPHNAQQVGHCFFKTPRECQCVCRGFWFTNILPN
ncbi:hypothetical protein KUTeg_022332 [Tegillarca granosa]|uniref:Uncharacterized protein n=1 Tax=Tegillarca granosa TaxID=220873 RepID=A0ABQ9E5X9_TEGGR|nr:hypothetical protein KUTeg_022332 [Tegillarca granosa]